MTNARDPDVESPVEPLYRLYNPEASIGGPVRKNRTFVYATVEQESESTQDGSELPDGSVLRQINAALASPGLARAATHQLAEPLFSTGSSSTLFFAKLDEQIDSANSVFVRYGFSQGSESNDVLGTNNFADRSTRGSSSNQDQSFAAGWTAAPSATLSSQLRAQYAHRGVSYTPNARGALIEIPGVVSFGQSSQLDVATSENDLQGVEALTLVRGNHQVGIGVNGQYIAFNNDLPNRFAGVYIFPTVADLAQETPDVFLQRFGDPHTAYSTVPVGVWLQDQWQPGHGITVVGGVRYDAQKLRNRFPVPRTTGLRV